jgi:hypothetical protein
MSYVLSLFLALLVLSGCVSHTPTTSTITLLADNKESAVSLEVTVIADGITLDAFSVPAGMTLAEREQGTPMYQSEKGSTFQLIASFGNTSSSAKILTIESVHGYPATYQIDITTKNQQISINCWNSGDIQRQCSPG